MRGRALNLGLADGNQLGPRPGVDARQFRFGHGLVCQCFLVFGDKLGIVDADQDSTGAHVLAALDRNLRNPAVDAGSNVGAGTVRLSLDH